MRDLNVRVERHRSCGSCMLRGRSFVGMDTDRRDSGIKRDILFLGLNPGIEEARQGRPFVGKSGTFLRKCLEDAGLKSWAMVNSILCSTGNQKQIPDEEGCHRQCRGNIAMFVREIAPRIIVPCGNGAASIFGLGTGINRNAGLTFVSRGPAGKARPTVVMPIKHPSALIRSGGESAPDYDQYMIRLEEVRGMAALIANGFDEDFLTENGVSFNMLFRN